MFDFLAKNYADETGWDNRTILLYIFIIISSALLAWFAQNGKVLVIKLKSGTIRPKFELNYFYLFLSFGIVCFFSAFRDVGADSNTYREIFIAADSNDIESYALEPGFVFLNKFFRLFLSKEYFGILVFSFLSFWLVYKTVVYFSSCIQLGTAVLALGCMFYLQSYNLLRIYLAAFFLLYCIRFLVKRLYSKYLICIFLAFFIHYSAIIMIIPGILYMVYVRNRVLFYIALIMFVCTSFMVINYLYSIILFERYEHYMNDGVLDTGIGIMQWVYHLPLIGLYYYLRKHNYFSDFLNIYWVYILVSFVLGLLSYKVAILGRVEVYFNVVYIIMLPYFLFRLKKNHDRYYLWIKVCVICYLFLRLGIYLQNYLYLDGIMPYKTYLF